MTIDGQVGAALLAGLVSGALVALVITAILLVALSRDLGWRARFGETTLRLPLVGVLAVNALMLLLTLAGLLFGAFYLAAGQPAFSVTVVALHALALVGWTVALGRPGWPLLAAAGSALAAFSLLLPALASSV